MPHAFDTLPTGKGSDATDGLLRFSVFAWAGLLIALLVCTVAGVAITREYTLFRERASLTAQNTTALIGNSVKGLVTRVDVSLRLGASYYAHARQHRSDTDVVTNTFLLKQRESQPDILNLRITDAQGNVVYGLDAPNADKVNLRDRSFFTEAQIHTDDRLIITGPVFARIAQQWVLVLARRLEDDQHRFLGVIYANVAAQTFASALSEVDLGPHGAATLRMNDMTLIYRSPRPTDGIGTRNVSTQLAAIGASGRQEGYYVAKTALDGIERINAYRRIEGLPIYVIVGLAPEDQANNLAFTSGLIIALSMTVLLVVGSCTYLIWKTSDRLHTGQQLRIGLETKLRSTQAALSKAQEMAKVGNWVWDADNGKTQWSKELFDIFGQDTTKDIPTLDELASHFEATSWARLKNAVDRCAASGEPYDIDCRLRQAGGTSQWINAKGQANRNEAGTIVKLYGTVQDITTRKSLEMQLAHANEELDDLYNRVPCGYYSLDEHGNYVKINDTMLSWIGYARTEVINKIGPRQSFTADSRIKFEANFPKFLVTGQIKDEEFELLDRHSRKRIVSVSASAVFDPNGKFVRSRSVMFDITELRKAQERIAQIATEQEGILHNQMVGALKVINRHLTWLNPALCHLFGYDATELMGHSTRMLYPDGTAFEQLGADAYPRLAAGETFRKQIQMKHKDGRLMWIDIQGVLTDPAAGESLWMLADISAIRQSQESFEFGALHDALTGLANRALMNGQMPQVLAHAKRQQSYAAVCYVDLDGFKPINDHYGHAAGDAVLKEVAKRLLASVRAVDTVARIGGDEFVVLLANLDTPEDSHPIMQRARLLIEQPIEVGEAALSVSMSIGIATFPVESEDPDRLLALADQRMYEDKSQRKSERGRTASADPTAAALA